MPIFQSKDGIIDTRYQMALPVGRLMADARKESGILYFLLFLQ
jgi:hypothetical protein